MTTAQDRLNQILPSWYDLLTQWSLDGSLVAAATDALMLEGSNAKQDAKGQLQSYVSQWSAGNFQNLPKVVLLSAVEISGALGAYADSTNTIYLNQEWLLGATEEEIQKVLTEELGHFLDDQLNKGDTQGDEGALFSLELFRVELSNLQKAAIKAEDDDVQIRDDKFAIDGEASISTNSFSPVLNLDFNGTSIQDTSSSNNSVTVLGTVLLSNSQALFNGIDSAVRIDSGQGFTLDQDFRISFDIIWDSQDDNNTTTLIDKRQSGLGAGGWSLRLFNDVVYWEGVGTAIGGNYFLSAPIERDIQHKVEVSRISGTIRLSIDDTEIASIYDPTNYTNSYPIRIGNNQDFGPDYGSNYFKGLLDNIAIAVRDSNNTGSPSLRGNSLYLTVNGPSWTEAETNAINLGGHLAAISSEGENSYLFSTFGPSSSPSDEKWIGLNDSEQEGVWKWSNGEEVVYTNWASVAPANNVDIVYPDGSGSETQDYVNFWWGTNDGTWDDYFDNDGAYDRKGIAEIPLTLAISFPTIIKEGSGAFTTPISLSAGNETSGNLAEGSTVYWKVSGISQEDLATGYLTGSGAITNGKLDIQHSLLDDGIAEQEYFEVSVYSDTEMLHQIGETYSGTITDSTPAVTIGTVISNATPIIVSGDLTNPKAETYTTTPSGKGRNATTVYNWTEILIDNATRPLDALVVNGGDSNNTITGAGFKDDPATTAIETRSAFSGVLVLDGKSGADTITGGTGTNWLIGGGVSASGTIDALTGTSLTKDVFDLRREIPTGVWSDAYAVGHAVINNFTGEDFIVLAGQRVDYTFNPKITQVLNKRGKVISESVSFEILSKSTNDLVATVAGSGFTSTTDLSSYVVFGQTTQGPFDVVLPGSTGGTII